VTTLTTWEELIFLVRSDKEFQKEGDKMLVEVIMLAVERSYLEQLRMAETFEIKCRKELVLEVSGYVCKKIDRRKKSLTSDMEEQLDSDTSQIQKATTQNVPPK